jgi:tetratricopeptide (TPR) repeat protein
LDNPDWGFLEFQGDGESTPKGKMARFFELAKAYAEKAKSIESIALFSAYLEEIDFVEDPDLLILATESALDTLCSQGRLEEAIELLSVSFSKLEPWANFHLGYLYSCRGTVHARMENVSSAIEDLRSAIAFFEADEQLEWSLPLRNKAGMLLLKTEHFVQAAKIVEPVLGKLDLDEQIAMRGLALSIAGKAELELGNTVDGIEQLSGAVRILKPLGHSELGSSVRELARGLILAKRTSQAKALLEDVLQSELTPLAKIDLTELLSSISNRDANSTFAGQLTYVV